MSSHKPYCASLFSFRACNCGALRSPKVEQAAALKGSGVQESTQRIAGAVELLKQAAPAMLADNSGPDGPLVGRLKPPAVADDVKSPSHYQLFEGLESIEVIARSMTVEMFKGFCLGNVLKYRLRAGKKSELATLEKDMAKATFYLELYEKHKGLCHD